MASDGFILDEEFIKKYIEENAIELPQEYIICYIAKVMGRSLSKFL